MYRNQLDQVRKNTGDLESRAARILERWKTSPGKSAPPAPAEMLESMAESPATTAGGDVSLEAVGRGGLAEAIVLAALRPAFFVLEGGIDLADAIEADPNLLMAIRGNENVLAKACKGVGRVDLINHFSLPYAGTGFLIDDALVVTNRHVAVEFAERLRSGYRFRKGRFGAEIEARLDYRHFLGDEAHLRAEVTRVLYIARDDEPDFALLRVAPLQDAPKLELLGGNSKLAIGDPVAVIGYPAEDGDRNDRALMDEVFRGQYRVKRFAPGFVTDRSSDGITLMADYSSLGGNSGSPLISLSDGRWQGLHFAGRFMENNYAVTADVIESARRQVISHVPVSSKSIETPVTAMESLRERNGYDPDFLGTNALSVPLPEFGTWADDIAEVEGTADKVLRYHNFSVVQSMSRRLPLVTAVNIDGAQTVRLKRKGKWRFDGRLDEAHQIGNALYASNPFDRGHMVRRRDPGWGPNAQAAEIDTFHYTNCVPQHEDLNQKDWLGLEDYVLEAAETRDFRVSVLTGPVFRDTDKRLKQGVDTADVRIPEEFWKVVAMVDVGTGQLSATGYVLSHGPMIRGLVESAFVYGSYKTYQVRIALIAEQTGLDFGALLQADPLGADLPQEAPFSVVARAIDGPDSLMLSAPRRA
ncbi:MAG: DNA/RNA non-specific endonuclease [Chromatiaceae bacterium]|nr:DNA/RNA non-specific endonuclease [Chromatiaceae bacterium]MCP5314904.1 DNA/RNA non-specific endonuclease [Chromatiaceae bacterium]